MSSADNGSSYQGRPLEHPDEELTDQGLRFDIGTLLNRRRMLQLLGVGAVGVAGAGLAACATGTTGTTAGGTTGATAGGTAASSSSGLIEIPDETSGPYPGDGSNGPDVLEQSGVVRSDITTSFGASTTRAEGVPLTITMTINEFAKDKQPMAGAAVDAA